VGLKTFVDPRVEGGKLNERAKEEDLVFLLRIDGKDQLFFKAIPINVCFLRGTYADENGNISMEKEPLLLETRSMAQATKNSGGIVIVQVEQKVKANSIHPKDVIIPGICVDIVVVVPDRMEHMPEAVTVTPSLAGNIRLPEGKGSFMAFDERKVIGRRAAMLLEPDMVVNLGIGVPEAVAAVAEEEGIGDFFTLTVESGQIGGIPQLGERFGTSLNPVAIIQQPEQFDFYDGGGLNLAYLGLAETDRFGNVNVSKLPTRIPGCGGFIDITQNTKTVVFMGTFTAKGLEIETGDGTLKIRKEGAVKKFVNNVRQITFSGDYARETGQKVYYMTERAVFELKKEGMCLTEIAPGIDIEKDILPHMEFVPKISDKVTVMDPKFFRDIPLGLAQKRR
jgi:propionate CoA-transferase